MRYRKGKICLLILLLSCNAQLFGQTSLPEAEQQRLADGLYSRGMYDLALTEYVKVLNQMPAPANSDLLNYRAGECAARSGQIVQARAFFNKAIVLGKQSLPAQRARYRLADDAFRNGNSAKAEQLLREIQQAEVHPSMDAPVRFTLAQILESRQQIPEALSMYKGLIQTHPEDSLSAYAALRVAALSKGEENNKREAYQQALKNPPSRDFEVEALWGLAALEVAEKKYPAAAEIYWNLWQNYPDSARVRGGMIHLAWAQLQAGEYEKALELADKTSEERKATDGDTWLYLTASSHLNLLQIDEAQTQFSLLLESFPQSRFRPVVAYELAGIYAEKGEHKKVSELAKDLQQVPGREVEGLWLLAESSRGAGETRQAMQLYTRIAHQYPTHARAGDALYFKALLLLENGEQKPAAETLSEFSRRFKEDPRAIPALIQSGDLWVQVGDLKQGVMKWQQALALQNPPEADLVFKVAMLEIRLEQFSNAKARLETFLDLNPEGSQLAGAQYWLGVLLERQGEIEASQASLAAALKGELKPEWQSAARMRLGQSYFKSGQSQLALASFLPLLGGAKENELSDPLLLWLISVAETENNQKGMQEIATAMTQVTRAAVTREWGFYALAKQNIKQGNSAAAIKNFQSGLAFDSGSEEAAEAQLALGGLLLSVNKYTEAFNAYGQASALASQLELGRIQALGLMGKGDVHAAQKQWAEAAKYYMSIAVLYDDATLSPQALQKAADAFRQSGDTLKADAADAEREQRYPEFSTETP